VPTMFARALQPLCGERVVVGAAVGPARTGGANCGAICRRDCTCDCDCGSGRDACNGDRNRDCAYGSGFDTSGLPRVGINTPSLDPVCAGMEDGGVRQA
jgi:hypothetical protein